MNWALILLKNVYNEEDYKIKNNENSEEKIEENKLSPKKYWGREINFVEYLIENYDYKTVEDRRDVQDNNGNYWEVKVSIKGIEIASGIGQVLTYRYIYGNCKGIIFPKQIRNKIINKIELEVCKEYNIEFKFL